MVLVHPNPPPGQGFARFYSYHFGGDPMSAPVKTNQTNTFLQTPANWSAAAGVDDPSKKVRKPYTITKSRESWTEQEHDKFLDALHLFDRDWKKIEAFVGSKTVIQIRSHAQKYFMKVQKSGTSEHVPPPRPKRKASHPYPHKAPKKVASQTSGPLSSSTLLDSKYALGPHPMPVPGNTIGNVPSYSWTYSGVPTGCASAMSKDYFTLSGGTTPNWSSNSNETAPQIKDNLNEDRANYIRKEHIRFMPLDVGTPDFAQVYSFIASLFDPSTTDQLETLKKMDPFTGQTVLMLMKNLSANLSSPEFENHRKLLSSYYGDVNDDGMDSEASL